MFGLWWTESWIADRYPGHGVAVRPADALPIPGEPLMSMKDAKQLTREAVLEFAADYVQAVAKKYKINPSKLDDLARSMTYSKP